MSSSKLFRKAFTAFSVLIALAAILFSFVASRGYEQGLRSQLVDRLRVTAQMIGHSARPYFREDLSLEERRALQASIHQIGDETGTRLTLVLPDGRVLADSALQSGEQVKELDNHGDRPELASALNQGEGRSNRYSATLDNKLLYLAVAINDEDGRLLGVARSALPTEQVDALAAKGRRPVAMFVLGMAIVGSLATRLLLARIIDPLLVINRAVNRMSAGELGHHIQIPNRDELGTLAQSFNQLNDDLKRRIDQIRERGEQLETVLGGMVEGVVAVDDQSRILFANAAAGKLFAFRPDATLGKPLHTLIRDSNMHKSIHEAMTRRQDVNAEIEVLDRQRTTVSLHAAPLPGEPCPGVVVVMYDITRIRRLEQLRQEFVANVSHELKTPLSAIKAYAETLLNGAIHDPENNTRFLGRIESQADRLNQLIMDLISLAKIESGEEAFDVGDVVLGTAVQNCLEGNLAAARAKQISLVADGPRSPIVVRADDEAIRQILENLVNNAIKYTPNEGTVTIRWRVDGAMAVVDVADTGIGIKKSHHERLFERFYRVDKARSRELGGTGLGLSIVKHLVQFFGGSVGVTSEVGKGTTFTVRLPLSEDE